MIFRNLLIFRMFLGTLFGDKVPNFSFYDIFSGNKKHNIQGFMFLFLYLLSILLFLYKLKNLKKIHNELRIENFNRNFDSKIPSKLSAIVNDKNESSESALNIMNMIIVNSSGLVEPRMLDIEDNIKIGYMSKYLDSYYHGNFIVFNPEDPKIPLSHKFFNKIEHTTAELCISTVYDSTVYDSINSESLIPRKNESKILKIKDLIGYHYILMNKERTSLLSLYMRIFKNICAMTNDNVHITRAQDSETGPRVRNIYMILSLIDEIMNKSFGIKIDEIVKYMNNYEVYNDDLCYWSKSETPKFIYMEELKRYTGYVYHF